MAGTREFPRAIDADTVCLLAALNGLILAPERAAELAPFVAGVLAGDEALAALELGVLPTVGLPWAPFMPLEVEGDDGE